ncbi:hypothetical protein AO262_02775 [Pseudomonas fluorescens ABAC62]|nr:hypothetical protein AO262_02775 [Pseudomonas fluorescens ABAC62]
MLQRVAAIVDNSSQANSGGDSLILGISIGGEVFPRYPLRAAFVVASDEALTQREVRRAVLFYAPGIEGGLQKFKSLAALTSSLQASVRAREPGGIWQCIGRGERNAARAWARGLKPDAMIKVVFDVIQGDVMSVGLKAQIQGLTDARQRVAGNERIFTEVADRVMGETLLGIEAAQGMQVPLNQARVLAMSNVQILISAAGYAAAQAGWYAGVSPVVSTRHQRMRLYQQRSELNLQRGLFTRMGALEPFVRELLTRQLSADGFTTLDIDAPLFDIPDDVNRVWASHPERPIGESGPKTVVSDERTTFSFLQLALHNLDPAAPWTRLRLANMKYLDSRWEARLSVDYLIQTISTLDVGGQYDRRILEAFYAEQHKEPDPLLRELVRRPVRRQAKMDLFSAKHQKTLSGEGQKLFSQALAGTPASSAKQSEQSFQIAFLRLEALTLPWARHVGGQMVIFDRQSGRCLLYWPGQSEGPSITEYTSRQALLNEQMQRGQSSTYIAQLAQAIAPGSETQAIASYPEGFTPQVAPISRWRSVLENLYVFSVFDPSSHITIMGAHLYKWFKTKRVFPAVALNEVESEIREQQEVGPHNWLAVTETDSRDMVGGLVHGRVQQQQRKARAECNSQADLAAYREWREGEAQDRRLRGLLSFVPGLGLGVAIYEVLSAARRFYHYGGWENGLELAFTIHMLIVEIAMTIVPAKLKVAVAKPFARSAGHGMNTALKQLQRGQRDLHWTPSHSPVPSKGLEGYKLSGPGENAVALKGPFNHGSYVKNGEQFVRDSKGARFGIYQREGEQHLRFKNPQTPGENELILHIREPRQWLLGADAPEPQPGPSSRVTQAWNVPPPARSPVGWVAPLVDPSEGVMRTPRNISSNWHRWAVVPESDRMVPIAPGSKLYRVDGRARQYLRVGQNYYETLPDGAQSSPNVVFIRPQEGFHMHRVEGTVLQLGVEGVEQPVPFTFGEDLRWTARQPLFNQPLSESIRSSFADMTPSSAQQVANRLVEMADTSGSSLTTTRLLTIRSTLDSWRTTGAGTMAQTDD